MYLENHCQNGQVVYRWKRGPMLPLVDGLRRGEAEDILQFPDGQAGLHTEPRYVFSCSFHIDYR